MFTKYPHLSHLSYLVDEYDVCIYGYNNSEEPDLVLYFTFRHRKAYSNVCDPFGSDCNHYIRAAGLDVWLEVSVRHPT